MKVLLLAFVMAELSSPAFAQTPDVQSAPVRDVAAADPKVATLVGHDVYVGVGGYTYAEPGEQSISIHGPKFVGGYTGTFSLGRAARWFARADVRGSAGNVTYDGWCAPFLIIPERASPNGYALDIGDYSPCSESGDKDWYVEGRALVGRDFVGQTMGLFLEAGLGVRHLSNGLIGVPGFRTDNYLYLPVAATVRTTVSRHALSFAVEYDYLLHGWQSTRDSALGSGELPATPITPPFTIDGFSDISFDQSSGWAVRASAKYQLTPRWSLEPSAIYWHVTDSSVSFQTATFTVNHVTARQQVGAYEPLNTTREFAVNFGFHF